jgi:signal transduction histidine kinase
MFQPQNRIPNWLAVALISISAVSFLVSLIPVVGQFISMLMWAPTFLILRMRGVSFSKNYKMIVSTFAAYIINLIPFVGGFLGYIGGIIYQIRVIRKEDKQRNAQDKQQYRAQQAQQQQADQERQEMQEQEEEEQEREEEEAIDEETTEPYGRIQPNEDVGRRAA